MILKIKPVEKKDLGEISFLLKEEFPYVQKQSWSVSEKLSNPSFLLLKASDEKGFVGFIEVEFMESSIARINGLAVKKDFRRRGYANKLVDYTLGVLEEFEIEKVLLLVKKSNVVAKRLYESKGFYCAGLHCKKIEGEGIEEYLKEFEDKDYMN
jgi:ribosomal protein S18 acetylase RimI-like enzyme